MAEKKIVVPAGMLEAAVDAMKAPSGQKFRSTEQWASCGLEAALLWLSVLPEEEFESFVKDLRK